MTLVKTCCAIEKTIEKLGQGIAVFTVIMVLLSFAIVVLRYGFNLGWIAMQESVLYMHGLIFMLGAAYTLKHDGHVRVDIFYHKMSKRAQAKVNLFGSLVFLLPFCLFIFFISLDYVLSSWAIAEKSPDAGGLPFVYLNKSFILLMALSLFLQGVAEVYRNISILRDGMGLAQQTEGAK